jgi:hypothetical protein
MQRRDDADLHDDLAQLRRVTAPRSASAPGCVSRDEMRWIIRTVPSRAAMIERLGRPDWRVGTYYREDNFLTYDGGYGFACWERRDVVNVRFVAVYHSDRPTRWFAIDAWSTYRGG